MGARVIAVVAVLVLAGCGGGHVTPGPAMTVRNVKGDGTMDVVIVPVAKGRTVTCVRYHDIEDADSSAYSGLSCDWNGYHHVGSQG